jgi:hypothetical protein
MAAGIKSIPIIEPVFEFILYSPQSLSIKAAGILSGPRSLLILTIQFNTCNRGRPGKFAAPEAKRLNSPGKFSIMEQKDCLFLKGAFHEQD